MTEYRIDVYCDGRVLRDSHIPSHADKVAKVITLEFSQTDKDDGRSDYWWTDNVPNAVSDRVHSELMRRLEEERATEGGSGLADRLRRWDRLRPEVAADMDPEGRSSYYVTIEMIDTAGKVHEQVVADDDVQIDHAKYLMRCPLCGLDLQRRADDVTPVFDQLMTAGVERVSLRGLVNLLS